MKCKGCKKEPKDIQEYVLAGQVEDMTPDEFVKDFEGTYNEEDQSFYCTECYIRAGMPRLR